MSLAIDVNKVEEVLLADGWHRVVSDTFELDSYEYVSASGPTQFAGGQEAAISGMGFTFTEQLPAGAQAMGRRTKIKGPLSAILAVREEG